MPTDRREWWALLKSTGEVIFYLMAVAGIIMMAYRATYGPPLAKESEQAESSPRQNRGDR